MMNSKTITRNETEAMIRLFRVVPARAITRSRSNKDLWGCVSRGFIVLDRNGAPMQEVPESIWTLINDEYGTDVFVANQTFHKAFNTVRTIDARDHVLQQVIHYFSTYGMEFFGLKSNPIIPLERLEIPSAAIHVNKLNVIRVCGADECVEFINHFAEATAAPTAIQVDLFRAIVDSVTIPLDNIKSFELAVIAYDTLNRVPTKPEMFLRYALYKVTDSTLVIKNVSTVKSIKAAASYKGTMLSDMFAKANLPGLASIFLRYKLLFLAMKSHRGMAPYINKLRRMADVYHRPQSDIVMKNFITLALSGRRADCQVLLERASNRELVKLVNALGARVNGGQDYQGVYQVRNGRTFVDPDTNTISRNQTRILLSYMERIESELAARLRPVLSGKYVVMPGYIDYAVPTTEKQFIGNIPWGSTITVKPGRKFTTGVWWFNQQGERVDIDLHMNSATEHFGWNGGFRSGDDEVLYTGDITDAPKPQGGAEAYYFDPNRGDFILSVNLFSGPDKTKFKLWMSEVKPNQALCSRRQYVFDARESLFTPIPLEFRGTRELTLGVFVNGQFVFCSGSVNRGIVPSANYEAYIAGLKQQLTSKFMMHELLQDTGAIIVGDAHDIPENVAKENIIDLTPEALTSTTLLDLVDGN